MTRYGPPDDGGYYAEDPYGQGDPRRVPPPPEEPTPWYRTPAAMFAAGILATLLLVFIVWAIMQTGSDDVPGAGEDAPLTPITPTATATAPPAERVTETTTVTETSAAPPVTSTITETPTAVETTTSTTVETTVSTETSTTTVTVTETPSPDE